MMLTPSDLLKKYDVPGPRYTSYPTILYWDNSPTLDNWISNLSEALKETEEQKKGAAIYIHVPFCRSLCTYCGCNTRITQNKRLSEPYVDVVLKEWDLYLNLLGAKEPIPLTELHIGGGTPTFLSADELERLVTGILKDVNQTSNAEFSIEADPRTTEKEQLRRLSGLGFKRLSLGIQDFDPKVQDIVNRIQTEEQVRIATEEARSTGFTSINYDLIYGLPFQTIESIEKTIEAVMRLRPDRIAFYAYAHVPWVKPGQRRFTEMDLPSADAKRALYERGRVLLESAGYYEIGMDHFALRNDSLWDASIKGTLHRSFMGYTSRHVAPLIGLGVSSIGDSWNTFVQNEKTLEAYTARVERGELPIFRGHLLTDEDLILRKHIMNLMTNFVTSWDTADLYVPYIDRAVNKLNEPKEDGLIELNQNNCKVTERGRPFLRNICMAFDARLDRKAPSTTLFSRTI
jgi:oxygen-independent coproporphyrinogen III oxidase